MQCPADLWHVFLTLWPYAEPMMLTGGEIAALVGAVIALISAVTALLYAKVSQLHSQQASKSAEVASFTAEHMTTRLEKEKE